MTAHFAAVLAADTPEEDELNTCSLLFNDSLTLTASEVFHCTLKPDILCLRCPISTIDFFLCSNRQIIWMPKTSAPSLSFGISEDIPA